MNWILLNSIAAKLFIVIYFLLNYFNSFCHRNVALHFRFLLAQILVPVPLFLRQQLLPIIMKMKMKKEKKLEIIVGNRIQFI